MEQLAADGKMEMLALVDEDEFAGLAINLIDEEQNRALLDYYAIAPEKRNGGYGSKGLEVLLERFKNYKYIFEIETQNEKAENAEERKRRKAFYLRNGLKETGLFVNVYDTDVYKRQGEGALRQHFLDMGLIPKGEVTMVKYAPMGDPMELRIHSYELTLRLADAEKIEKMCIRDRVNMHRI